MVVVGGGRGDDDHGGVLAGLVEEDEDKDVRNLKEEDPEEKAKGEDGDEGVQDGPDEEDNPGDDEVSGEEATGGGGGVTVRTVDAVDNHGHELNEGSEEEREDAANEGDDVHHLHVNSSLLLDDDDVLAVSTRGASVNGLLLVTTWGTISGRSTIDRGGGVRGGSAVDGGRGVRGLRGCLEGASAAVIRVLGSGRGHLFVVVHSVVGLSCSSFFASLLFVVEELKSVCVFVRLFIDFRLVQRDRATRQGKKSHKGSPFLQIGSVLFFFFF